MKAAFEWHLMADGMPEKGRGNYIVMGANGALYLALHFEGYGDSGDEAWFRDTRGNFHYLEKVKAWAEIPPLEVSE